MHVLRFLCIIIMFLIVVVSLAVCFIFFLLNSQYICLQLVLEIKSVDKCKITAFFICYLTHFSSLNQLNTHSEQVKDFFVAH